MALRAMTVLGPITPEELGVTLPHEHIIIDLRYHEDFDLILDDVPLAIDEVAAFKRMGGATIIDVTNGCMGRDVRALKRVSEATGVHVVTSTGFYVERYYTRDVYEKNINRLADYFVSEINDGIEGTGIKAGIIGEIATERDFISPAGERVFRAAARAHRRTGAPITTHTYLEQLLQDQLDIFEDEGVDLRRVIIGHLGDYRELDRLRAVGDRGAFLQIDHIGYPVQQRDTQRAETVARLVEAGYGTQILLSMDICAKSRLHWYGGHGYDYLQTNFRLMLAAVGVSERDIDMMMIENPKRALTFEF